MVGGRRPSSSSVADSRAALARIGEMIDTVAQPGEGFGLRVVRNAPRWFSW